MPGMMDTILNLGLNDQSVEGLKARTQNGRFAFDSYRRFMQMFGSVVLEIPKAAFEHEFDGVKASRGVKLDTDLDEAALREVVARYKDVVKKKSGKAFPQDRVPRLDITVTKEQWKLMVDDLTTKEAEVVLGWLAKANEKKGR